jgi:hypothetical protein
MAGYYIPLVGTPQIGDSGGGGGGGGVLVVHDTDGTLDKTWQEIHDAMLSGGAVYVYSNGGISVFVFAGSNGSQYHVDTASGDEFYTSTTDGYPQMG